MTGTAISNAVSTSGNGNWIFEVGDEGPFEVSVFGNVLLDIFKDELSEDSIAPALTKDTILALPCIELYDSGSAQCLSPYHDQFTFYHNIITS